MSGMRLLASDALGVYIPQNFCELHDPVKWSLVEDDADWLACMAGPDKSDFYWDSWDWILTRAIYKDADGHSWTLYQNGDLWAVCVELMTDEEYEGYFGEPRQDVA